MVAKMPKGFKLIAVIGKPLVLTSCCCKKTARFLLGCSRVTSFLSPRAITVPRTVLSCSRASPHDWAVRVTGRLRGIFLAEHGQLHEYTFQHDSIYSSLILRNIQCFSAYAGSDLAPSSEPAPLPYSQFEPV